MIDKELINKATLAELVYALIGALVKSGVLKSADFADALTSVIAER